jgi:hypothetical protein
MDNLTFCCYSNTRLLWYIVYHPDKVMFHFSHFLVVLTAVTVTCSNTTETCLFEHGRKIIVQKRKYKCSNTTERQLLEHAGIACQNTLAKNPNSKITIIKRKKKLN